MGPLWQQNIPFCVSEDVFRYFPYEDLFVRVLWLEHLDDLDFFGRVFTDLVHYFFLIIINNNGVT